MLHNTNCIAKEGFLTYDFQDQKIMSQAPLLYCPCWDPWKGRTKKLVKTKVGSLNQKLKKPSSGGILKDQSKVQLNPSNISRVKFSTKTYVQPLRSRAPQDISKVFEEEITPGFTLSHSKEHIDVTLGEEFFEKQKPTEETIKTTVPGTPPKLETEDVVADLVEQISELTAIIEQLRRDHQVTHKQLEKDMEEKCTDMQEEHDNKMREIQGFHILEVNNLEEQYKKELRNERATAQEKLGMMHKYLFISYLHVSWNF
ncbi:flagellum-associated coiled-coil domain-containing protein 1-like, partial [Crotalus tigris]|uniref:flagellum-associated coiled-coil domain-containing protein 1-like n=1 Tax=Crotalus tigris TaxID=88082 RepID=UPI00192F83D9